MNASREFDTFAIGGAAAGSNSTTYLNNPDYQVTDATTMETPIIDAFAKSMLMGRINITWNRTSLHFSVYKNISQDDFDDSFLDEYLAMVMGPKTLSMTMLIPITVIYMLIFVSGVVGNLSTCLVIVKSKNLQTATNYYLFSLAIADTVSLVLGLPNDLTVYWRQYPYIFGHIVCSLRALISEMTNNASVLTIVAFTVERYLAICHPLYKQKMSHLSRVVKIISLVWLVAFASAVPFAMLTRITYQDYPGIPGKSIEESAFCSMSVEKHYNLALLFSSLIFFVVPVIFISILYIKIGLTLRNSKITRLSKESYSSNSRQQCPKKVLKILVSVVLAFVICWAPFHAQRLMFVFLTPEDWQDANLRDINEKLYYVAGCFYYFNCTTNPILYSLISDKYRKAYKETLCCCFFNQTGDRRDTGDRSSQFNGFGGQNQWTMDRISRSKISAEGVFAPGIAYVIPTDESGDAVSCNAGAPEKVQNEDV